MKKVPDYILIEGNSTMNLQAAVINAIAKGYTPLGGACVIQTTTEGYKYFQAAVKYED